MKRFLVAVDGSKYSWRALDEAIAYSKAVGAEILVLHVVPVEHIPKELKVFAEIEEVAPGDVEFAWRKKAMLENKIIMEVERRLRDEGVQSSRTLVHEGDPAESILAVASEHHVDMIFVGDRGLGALQHLLMGSVAHKVVNLSKCTCVVAK